MVEGYDSSVRGKVSLGIFHCYTALDGTATYYLKMYKKEKEELDSAYDGTCILRFMSKAYRVEFDWTRPIYSNVALPAMQICVLMMSIPVTSSVAVCLTCSGMLRFEFTHVIWQETM